MSVKQTPNKSALKGARLSSPTFKLPRYLSLSLECTSHLNTINKTIADIIRTCLGPRAMLKMLLDPMGGIVMTNDGNAILREVEVAHPAAKSMIELSRTQDEEVGDGTTSVIILGNSLVF